MKAKTPIFFLPFSVFALTISFDIGLTSTNNLYKNNEGTTLDSLHSNPGVAIVIYKHYKSKLIEGIQQTIFSFANVIINWSRRNKKRDL